MHTALRSLWLPVQRDPAHPRNPADKPGAWHSAGSRQDKLIMTLLNYQHGGSFVDLAAKQAYSGLQHTSLGARLRVARGLHRGRP